MYAYVRKLAFYQFYYPYVNFLGVENVSLHCLIAKRSHQDTTENPVIYHFSWFSLVKVIGRANPL